MSERPPKQWFYSAVEAIRRKRPGVKDPFALAGWSWANWMTPEAKEKVLKSELYDPAPVNQMLNTIEIDDDLTTLFLDMKIPWEDANYIKKGPEPFICGNCRLIVYGGQDAKFDRCQIIQGPYEDGQIQPGDTCRFFHHKIDARLESLI